MPISCLKQPPGGFRSQNDIAGKAISFNGIIKKFARHIVPQKLTNGNMYVNKR